MLSRRNIEIKKFSSLPYRVHSLTAGDKQLQDSMKNPTSLGKRGTEEDMGDSPGGPVV